MKSLSIALSLVSLCCLPTPAQTFGEITGEVRDAGGGLAIGARVILASDATSVTREISTNESGIYGFPSLLPGSYSLRVEMKGFATSSRKNVLLQVQQTVRADFVLQVGEVTQVVEITATAGLLNTDDATIGTVIENKRIVDLPLNGRNFLQLVALSPNVSFGFANNQTAPSRQGGQRSQQNISVAGARPTFNRFTLDGIEDTDVNFLSYVFFPLID